jgi:hypothetical protein
MRRFCFAIAGAAALAACGGGNVDIEELKKGQKDILAKLENVEKSVQQIRTQPPAAPARAMPDPNKVHNIPIGSSPVKGPRTAKVTIAEFSDFQ